MVIWPPIYLAFSLSQSFVCPDMLYIRCVRAVSVLVGVSVLLNVHHAPQCLQLRCHICYILPLIVQEENSTLFVIVDRTLVMEVTVAQQ